MANISLGYKDDTTAWASVDSAQKKAYRYLSLKTRQTTAGIDGTTKRGRNFSHVLHTWNIYDVVISADAFYDAADRTFMQAFCAGLHRAISLDGGTTWIDITFARGDEPVEFIEGASALTEYTFTLTATEPE